VHAGQFARQNVTDCARCHSDKGKFTETSFDHQRDSVFKLDADHMKLACAACHRPTQVAANLTIIRYRPLGTRCEDCHDSRGLGARRAP
jgi:mono/diheme cytochrome c family protein